MIKIIVQEYLIQNMLSKKEAEEKLKNKKISGYLEFTNDNVNITVNSTGVNETIIKYVVSELKSDRKIMNDLVKRSNKITK